MRKTIFKAFWAWEFDKEEKWLNEKAANGLALTAVAPFLYTFEKSEPGEYAVCLELLENLSSHDDSQRYISFMEETGAEYLGCVFRWVYFRRKAADGKFDLYSDHASRIKHLNRIMALLSAPAIIELCVAFSNLHWFIAREDGIPANLGVSLAALLFGLLIVVGIVRIYRKKRKLQRESRIYEA